MLRYLCPGVVVFSCALALSLQLGAQVASQPGFPSSDVSELPETDPADPAPLSVPPFAEEMTQNDVLSDEDFNDMEFTEFDEMDPFADIFGPQEEMSPTEAAIAIAVYALIILVAIAIKVVILWFLRSFLLALPEEHRQMPPNHVWFALIPCFHLVWNFIMYQKISRSYRAYFAAQNRTDVGDCGEGLGLSFSICAVVTSLVGAIPCVGACIAPLGGIAMLVLLIIYMVKVAGLKAQIATTPLGQA